MDVDDYQLSNCRTAQRKQVITIASEMRIRELGVYKIAVDFREIVDAISKAIIRAEEKKIEERIRQVEGRINYIDLLAGAGALKSPYEQMPGPHSLIDEIVENQIRMIMGYTHEEPITLEDLMVLDDLRQLTCQYRNVLELELLEKRRQELRTLRKIKTERVSAIIKIAWLRRNLSVGRSSTSSVNDPMLLSIPTPPTLMAANCSQGSGGTVSAFI